MLPLQRSITINLHSVFQILPPSLQSAIRNRYYRFKYGATIETMEKETADKFFKSYDHYQQMQQEFYERGGPEIINDAREQHKHLTDGAVMGEISIETASKYYAIFRSLKPGVTIETGVCNGVSTFALLFAMEENGSGKLISVDYPFHGDGDIERYKKETTNQFGGSTVPADKQPGWFIDEKLQKRWTLVLGKSQVELPKLRTEYDTIDMFVHDSEHTLPCMLFEFELAWNWLRDGGVLLSDDIIWGDHDAWHSFTSERCDDWGYIAANTGYAIR